MEQEDSLKKRYVYKVIANILAVATGAITQMIIPRTLGPAQYGNFSFLTDFFLQLFSFLNMGTGTAFYTKLSKRQKEQKLVSFYLFYILLAVLLGVGMVFAAKAFGWEAFLWPQQDLRYIYMALIFAGLSWYSLSMNDIVDAYGLTVAAEKIKIIQKMMGVGIVLFLFWRQWLSLDAVFYYNHIMFLLMILSFFYICRKHSLAPRIAPLSRAEIKAYAAEFYQYSKPLFIYSLVGLGVGIFDRWFLQVAGGGVEQGFFSLSYKIGALCFILTAAMTQLITREFSIAYDKKDIPLMAKLFRRHIPLLYGITGIIACFMVVNADKMAFIMGGKEFKSAVVPVAIMALYPMHQTYGQLSGAVFYATDQIRLYSLVVIAGMIAGVFMTYFFLASPVQCGLGFGAVGLALKMVIMSIIINNILLYFNARFLKISFHWYVLHQFISMGVFLAMAYFVTCATASWFHGYNILLHFILTGGVYLCVVAGGVYFFPGLLGLDRRDINMIMAKVFPGIQKG